MLDSVIARRRWLGVLCLAIAFAMLTWGQTLLKPYLTGHLLLAYWLVFLAFTGGTIAIGLVDFFAVRRFFKSERARVEEQARRLASTKARRQAAAAAAKSHPRHSRGGTR